MKRGPDGCITCAVQPSGRFVSRRPPWPLAELEAPETWNYSRPGLIALGIGTALVAGLVAVVIATR